MAPCPRPRASPGRIVRMSNGLPGRSFPASVPDDCRTPSRAAATPSREKAVGSKPVSLATALTTATFSCTISQSMPGRLDLDPAAAIGLRERRSSSPLSPTDERGSATMTAAGAPRLETSALSPEYKAISVIGWLGTGQRPATLVTVLPTPKSGCPTRRYVDNRSNWNSNHCEEATREGISG